MVYTSARLLPDVDKVVVAALQDGIGLTSVSTEAPANLYTRLPWVVAYRFGGTELGALLADRATVQVQCWGASRELAADLAETCRVVLFRAALRQAVYGDGYINKFDEVLAPAEVRTNEQPDRVWRFDSTYSLRVRPAH